MPRYRLDIEYDGSPYAGWQAQNSSSRPAVQRVIERALEKFCRQPVRLTGASRTDAGVHACRQTAHADFSPPPQSDIAAGVNFYLRRQGDNAVVIRAAQLAGDNFHARFSARRRHYLYCLLARPEPLALLRLRAWHIARPLNAKAMAEAAQCLIGHHDFTSFCAAAAYKEQGEKPLLRTLESARVESQICPAESSGQMYHLHFSAPSFVRSQIRSMTAAIVRAGSGVCPPAEIGRILRARRRELCPPPAPPHGLYLLKIDYDDANDRPR